MYSPVKSHKHTAWKLYSHILDILSFMPSLVCFPSSHFCILLFWRAALEIRDQWPYSSTRDLHTVWVFMSMCRHEECARGDSQKCTIALYPKKLGQRGLWFEGGVLWFWCGRLGGLISLTAGEQTMMRGEQEKKAKITGDVQPITRNQDCCNLLPLQHTNTKICTLVTDKWVSNILPITLSPTPSTSSLKPLSL